jgi:hypothetical protein
VIHDATIIEHYQISDYPGVDAGTEWTDVLYSTDILAGELGEESEKKYPFLYSDEYNDVINNIDREIQSLVSKSTHSLLDELQQREVKVQFYFVVSSRAKFGIVPQLIEEQFYRYHQAYGFPCGWLGEFPEGELVVFSARQDP